MPNAQPILFSKERRYLNCYGAKTHVACKTWCRDSRETLSENTVFSVNSNSIYDGAKDVSQGDEIERIKAGLQFASISPSLPPVRSHLFLNRAVSDPLFIAPGCIFEFLLQVTPVYDSSLRRRL